MVLEAKKSNILIVSLRIAKRIQNLLILRRLLGSSKK